MVASSRSCSAAAVASSRILSLTVSTGSGDDDAFKSARVALHGTLSKTRSLRIYAPGTDGKPHQATCNAVTVTDNSG